MPNKNPAQAASLSLISLLSFRFVWLEGRVCDALGGGNFHLETLALVYDVARGADKAGPT